MQINAADTAWLLFSTALVLLMTPALAFFYGGMVRKKNLLSTIMMSFSILALVSLLWILYGYSLSFAPAANAFIGSLQWLGPNGGGEHPPDIYAKTVPPLALMMF